MCQIFVSSFGRKSDIELHIGTMTKCHRLVVKVWVGSLYACLNNSRLIPMSGAFKSTEIRVLNLPMRYGSSCTTAKQIGLLLSSFTHGTLIELTMHRKQGRCYSI